MGYHKGKEKPLGHICRMPETNLYERKSLWRRASGLTWAVGAWTVNGASLQRGDTVSEPEQDEAGIYAAEGSGGNRRLVTYRGIDKYSTYSEASRSWVSHT